MMAEMQCAGRRKRAAGTTDWTSRLGSDGKGAVCQRRPSGYEGNLARVLLEVYSPWTLVVSKLVPTALLRGGKVLALLLNEKVGYWALNWRPGESRLLDWVGQGTKALCRDVYGEQVDQAFVKSFLVRRFFFCSLTSVATVIQVTLDLTGRPSQYAAILSLLLAPITLVDRQFATLVTKMGPRHDRSLLFQLLLGLTDTLKPSFSDVPAPAPARAAGSTMRLCNLTQLEMMVGFVQFVAGLVLAVWTALVLSNGHKDLAPLCFSSGGGMFCFHFLPMAIAARCIKEICNWTSAFLEWKLTPSKYASNASMVSDACEHLLDRIGGIKSFEDRLRTDPRLRKGCAQFAAQHLVQAPEPGGLSWCPFARVESQGQLPDEAMPMLPSYLHVPLGDTALGLLEVTCNCLEGVYDAPRDGRLYERQHSTRLYSDRSDEHVDEHAHPEHAGVRTEARPMRPSLFRALFLHEHQHVFPDGGCIVHAHGKLPAASRGWHTHSLQTIYRVGKKFSHMTEVSENACCVPPSFRTLSPSDFSVPVPASTYLSAWTLLQTT